MIRLAGRVYQAVQGFEDHLIAELAEAGCSRLAGPLFHAEGQADGAVFWHRNCWLEPFQIEFSSISEAASLLRGIQRNWSACLHTQFRRGALIGSKLPPISARPRPFPWQPGESAVGAWTLLDAHTMIASALCSSPFPGGAVEFEQDKEGPPSRAYLKLWEALARLRRWPRPADRCIDAGASPGGWSWALARLGAQVIAIDRAPLESRVAALPAVRCLRRDAFAIKPQEIASEAGGAIDWLFCDAACYPPRLYGWIQKWLESGLCRNFVCTLKMQGGAGSADFATPRLFAAIPGSMVAHLYHNKHELTWMYCNPPHNNI